MRDGFHKYQFVANDDFFAAFENSPIQQGDFEINLGVDKRGHISEFVFDLSGRAKAVCDRCLAEIRLPVSGRYVFHGKISSEAVDDEEIITIKPEQSHIDLSQYIYEMICLSLPLTNVYDCENEIPRVCDDTILGKLSENINTNIEEKPEVSVWENLKGLIEDN